MGAQRPPCPPPYPPPRRGEVGVGGAPRDLCGRTVTYLRVSVTDRCNLRCRYCMPARGVGFLPASEILRFEEIAQVVRAAVGLGITCVRLTGGEPLRRRDLGHLVALIAAIPGIGDLSLTTNGTLLAGQAAALAQAGLRRVNVSLDTLDPPRYAQITRGGDVRSVLRGIEAALAAGLDPVKINAVAVTGAEDDIASLGALSRSRPLHVRFIEAMPVLGPGSLGHLTAERILEILARAGDLEPVSGPVGSGPARSFRYAGAEGTVGVIAPMSRRFCDACNRLRLTATGRLRPCLFSANGYDLRPLLRPRSDDAALRAALVDAISGKPPARPDEIPHDTFGSMCQVGG